MNNKSMREKLNLAGFGAKKTKINYRSALALVIFAVMVSMSSATFAQPVFSKSFAPSTIAPGGTSTLTFVIDNSGGGAVNNISFLDNLPASVVIANPPNTVNNCNGMAVPPAAPGATFFNYSGGSVAAGVTCTISINVTSNVLGDHINSTTELSTSAGNAPPAQATLTVANPPPPSGEQSVPAISPLGLGILVSLVLFVSYRRNNRL